MYQKNSALPNIKYECTVLILKQMYWLFIMVLGDGPVHNDFPWSFHGGLSVVKYHLFMQPNIFITDHHCKPIYNRLNAQKFSAFPCSTSISFFCLQTVIKKVVRRYIFERLQASVSNEGDLDTLKQTISGLQEEIKVKSRDVEHVAMQQSQVIETLNSLREMTSYLENTTAQIFEHVTGSAVPPAPPSYAVAGAMDTAGHMTSPSHVRRRTFGPLLDNGMQSVIETGDEESEAAS